MTQLQDRTPETTTEVAPSAGQSKQGPKAGWYAAALAATVLTGAALAMAIGNSGETTGPTSSLDPEGEVAIVAETTGTLRDPRVYHQPRHVAPESNDSTADPYEELFWSRQTGGGRSTDPDSDPYEELFWSRQTGGGRSTDPGSDPFEEQFWANAQD